MFETLRQKFADFILPNRQPLGAVAVNGLPPSLSGSLDADGLAALIREAEGGNMDRYLRLCAEIWGGDSTVLTCAFHRKAGLLCQPWQINAPDGSGPDGEMKAKLLRWQVTNCVGLRSFFNHSLDSFMWPVAVARRTYKPSTTPGLYYDLASLEPVPFYRLDFRGGGGEPAGTIRLKKADGNDQILNGLTEPLRPMEHVVHRGHLLKTFPDTWGGPFRAALFWWFFSVCARQWWARSLNKSGLPFFVGRVSESDKKGKAALLRAFNSTANMLGLVVSEATKIEMHKTLDAAATDSFDRFHRLCRQQLSALITGSTQTVEAQAQGLGGGQAAVQDSRFDNITTHDGAELAETMKEQIFKPWLQLNGLSTENCPEISWGATVEDATAKTTMVKTASDAGLQLTEAGIQELNEVTGLQFERKPAAPPALPGVAGFSAPAVPALRLVDLSRQAGDRINEAAAADLADAFRGDLAPIRRLLRESSTAAEFEAAVSAFYADWQPGRTARIIEEALTAHAANGIIKSAAAGE